MWTTTNIHDAVAEHIAVAENIYNAVLAGCPTV
jgi:hypothetical protein